MVREADESDAIIIPVLKGTLPAEASRTEVESTQNSLCRPKALLVHPVVQLKETAVSDEVVRSIFEGEFKDLKTKAFEYFVQIFADRYGREEADRIAHGALNLIEPLTRKQDDACQASHRGADEMKIDIVQQRTSAVNQITVPSPRL